MTNYRLYCFDRDGAIVCRDDFEADNNVEAKGIASAICDACSDEHYTYELWKGDLPIAGGQTLASVLQVGGLSAKARQIVIDHEIALQEQLLAGGPEPQAERASPGMGVFTADASIGLIVSVHQRTQFMRRR